MKEHIGIMNVPITEEIVNKVFHASFNDGRRKCGLVGIRKAGNGWYINTVQHFTGKHINRVYQLDNFLRLHGVPFNFLSLESI